MRKKKSRRSGAQKRSEKNKRKIERIFVISLLSVILTYFIHREIYIHQKLTNGNTEILQAEIVDAHYVLHVRRGGWEMKCKYIVNGKEYICRKSYPDKLKNEIKVGKFIELKVSLDDVKVTKWNKDRGAFSK